MKRYIFCSVFIFLFIMSGFSQEVITLSTYYPAPFGVYQDLTVHNLFTFKDRSKGVRKSEAYLYADSDSNLHIGGKDSFGSREDYHIIFDDVNRPYAYLQPFSGTSGETYCARSYISANFLTLEKIPVGYTYSLPSSGFYVCVRGWEMPAL